MLFSFTVTLFASYKSQLNDFELKKESLIDRYTINIELAKIDKLYKRKKVLSKTLYCIKQSKSSTDIDNCESSQRRRVLNIISKKYMSNNHFDMRNEKIEIYKKKLKNTKMDERKYSIKKTISCIEKSKNIKNINICMNKDNLDFKRILLSYEDNPRLRNIKNKEYIINRYKIRIESARTDRLYKRMEIFSKTLLCLKYPKNSIKTCKKNEKNRILKLLNG